MCEAIVWIYKTFTDQATFIEGWDGRSFILVLMYPIILCHTGMLAKLIGIGSRRAAVMATYSVCATKEKGSLSSDILDLL